MDYKRTNKIVAVSRREFDGVGHRRELRYVERVLDRFKGPIALEYGMTRANFSNSTLVKFLFIYLIFKQKQQKKDYLYSIIHSTTNCDEFIIYLLDEVHETQ